MDNNEEIKSISDMKAQRKKDFERLINVIRENIKKHKQGEIDRLPSYYQYSKQFGYTPNTIKRIMKENMNHEEIDYIKNFWKEHISKDYSREGWKKKMIIGDYAENLVKEHLEKEGWEVIKVSIKESKPFLTLNNELKQKKKEIFELLQSIKETEKCYLPDFFCFNEESCKFVEVKSGLRIYWHDEQINGINLLREKGHIVEVIIPEFQEGEIKILLDEENNPKL